MAAKQEVIAEAAEGVVPVSARARAPSAGEGYNGIVSVETASNSLKSDKSLL